MAGGSFAPTGVAKERAQQYQGRLTPYVIVACIVAAVGGSLFGYDIGISGYLSRFCWLALWSLPFSGFHEVIYRAVQGKN
ncbi:hypothetical protein FF2_025726 [Malus domestica]